MGKSLTQTVRILKPARIRTDERGRTVWDGPIEETELELVSATELRSMLASGDGERRRQLKKGAAGKEGPAQDARPAGKERAGSEGNR